MFGRKTYRASGTAPLFHVDFTALPLGAMSAASLLAATGLTFTRASDSTVQTSVSTLDATPSTNDACLGADGSGARGLVIQNNVFQRFGGSAGDTAPIDLTSLWIPGTATTTHGSQPSPDGTTTTSNRIVAASGQFSPFGGPVTTDGTCVSTWQRSTANSGGTPMQQVVAPAIDTGGKVTVAAATNVYQRLLTSDVSGSNVILCCDCRNFVDVPPGTAPQARDVLCTYLQWEWTTYPTEAIAQGRVTRRAERVSFASASTWVVGGNIKLGLVFYPKFATSEVVRYGSGGSAQAKLYLFSFVSGMSTHNYVRIDPTSRKVEVKVGGATATSTGTVTWASGDRVEVRVAIGTTCSARIAINGGAFTDLVLSASLGAPAPAGAAFFCLDESVADGAAADTGQPPMRAAEVTIYGAAPF